MPDPAILGVLSIISFVHVDPLTSEYFSGLLCFTPLFSCLCVSCLAQHETLQLFTWCNWSPWSQEKKHWVFESWLVSSALVLELHRHYSKTSHILLNSDCCHFSLVAFLTLELCTGITLGCDHTLVALRYVYFLWLKGRSSQKSISDALPVSTLSEHHRGILSKTKL